MWTSGFNLNQLSKSIVGIVLEENIMDKTKLELRVRSFLSAFIQKFDKPKLTKTVTDKERERLFNAEKRQEFEKKYWLNELRKVLSEDEMKEKYINLDKELIENNFLINPRK